MHGQIDVVEHLVEQGAQVNCKDENDVCIRALFKNSPDAPFCTSCLCAGEAGVVESNGSMCPTKLYARGQCPHKYLAVETLLRH